MTQSTYQASEGDQNDTASSYYGTTVRGSSIHSDMQIHSETQDAVALSAEYITLIEGESCPTGLHNCRSCDHQHTEAWLNAVASPTLVQGGFPPHPTDENLEIERLRVHTTSQVGLEGLSGGELWERLRKMQADSSQGSLLVGAGSDKPVDDDGSITAGEEILVPEHPDHAKISWVSCIVQRCQQHLVQKMKYKWFPRRFSGKPLDTPYLIEDVGVLMPIYRNSRGYAFLETSPGST
ncbi:hypothetical protein NPX13_g568 [Xylaria arbuscula]|uniref:Uncharacterized protein n=1 Tax=Xylaria arbuscula TaxID=114810 RepID=A0A9W8TSD8_9PEZI|nr:hypothetical protein NPX13_g568 [Xylaria arbuscula]